MKTNHHNTLSSEIQSIDPSFNDDHDRTRNRDSKVSAAHFHDVDNVTRIFKQNGFDRFGRKLNSKIQADNFPGPGNKNQNHFSST
jgi:hypothetical protein